MTVVGFVTVHNEEHILKDVLDHYGKHMNIVVYDDGSTDRTIDIAASHKSVLCVMNRDKTPLSYEGDRRWAAYNRALVYDPEWVVCFDADEFVEFDWTQLYNKEIDFVKMKVWDYYITQSDVHQSYKERKFLGPEYRFLNNIWRPHSEVLFSRGVSREPGLPNHYRPLYSGDVKHYGKALSVDLHQRKVDHYTSSDVKYYRDRWAPRNNKAIHTESDFGNKLIEWEDREKHGVLLKG